ncbi:MAG: class I tRNA ligase family protein [Planctomycetes bacterium]|nr:class I tRNA ligase family protein [Planctomycetota bacterium]
MALKLYNTLTNCKEAFEPVVAGKVGMYVCGPTVYKDSHIGHAVGPVIFDAFKKYLVHQGYEVKLVINITDVDDKIIAEADRIGICMEELAEQVTANYFECLDQLGVDSVDEFPRATEHIAEILVECCDWTRIHLDGATPESYARRHAVGPSGLNQLKRNLTHLNQLAEERDAAIEIGIGSVVNYDNFSDVEKLADFAFETGCKYIQVKPDFELLLQRDYTDWWADDVASVLRGLESKYSDTPFSIHYTDTETTREPVARTCHIHHLSTSINATSELTYCKRLRDKSDWSPGNLAHDSLKTILKSDRNKKLSIEITPQNCGILCPYLELNEHIESLVSSDLPIPHFDQKDTKHPNFF